MLNSMSVSMSLSSAAHAPIAEASSPGPRSETVLSDGDVDHAPCIVEVDLRLFAELLRRLGALNGSSSSSWYLRGTRRADAGLKLCRRVLAGVANFGGMM